MRSLIYTLVVAALILVVLGLVLKALKWLIIIGLIALGVSVMMGIRRRGGAPR
jgi:hypothetical protein